MGAIPVKTALNELQCEQKRGYKIMESVEELSLIYRSYGIALSSVKTNGTPMIVVNTLERLMMDARAEYYSAMKLQKEHATRVKDVRV